MDFGRGDVLEIPKCPLQNGCTTGTYIVFRRASSRVGCSPTSGVPEVWDRAGAPTPLCAGRSPTCLDEERCVVTSTAWEGALCVCVCLLQKVISKFVAACYYLWLDCGYLLWLMLILNVLFKIASSLHIIKESIHHSNSDFA